MWNGHSKRRGNYLRTNLIVWKVPSSSLIWSGYVCEQYYGTCNDEHAPIWMLGNEWLNQWKDTYYHVSTRVGGKPHSVVPYRFIIQGTWRRNLEMRNEV